MRHPRSEETDNKEVSTEGTKRLGRTKKSSSDRGRSHDDSRRRSSSSKVRSHKGRIHINNMERLSFELQINSV